MAWAGFCKWLIYLVNEPVQRALGTLLVRVTGADAVLFTWLWIPSAILLPILAAAWLHKYVELPGQDRGRHLARDGHGRGGLGARFPRITS